MSTCIREVKMVPQEVLGLRGLVLPGSWVIGSEVGPEEAHRVWEVGSFEKDWWSFPNLC